MTRTCEKCEEPAQSAEKLDKDLLKDYVESRRENGQPVDLQELQKLMGWLCAPCVVRMKEFIRGSRVRHSAPSEDTRHGFRNEDRAKKTGKW